MNFRDLIALLFLILPTVAFGSETSLYLSPVTGVYDTNTVFQVRVLVDTGVDKINAVEGTLTFDPKELQVDRIEYDHSILPSWTLQPRYDNDKGEIVFAGLTSTSSFSGDRGEVISLYLRGARSTETRLNFQSGSAVLAGDGTGTNVLAVMKSGVYSFVPKENVPELPQQPATNSGGEVLGAAIVKLASPTDPDESAWYNKNSADFVWQNPPATIRVRLSLTKTPAVPAGGKEFEPPIEKRTVSDIDDGISYFHVTKDLNDGSSESETYKLQIDTKPPSVFDLKEDQRVPEDPRVSFTITATDTLSGIERIEFSLDGGTPNPWKDIASRKYEFSVGIPGRHKLRAVAYDRAGNTLEESAEFTVEPLAAPKIELSAPSFKENESISLTASGVPGSTLTLTLTSPELPDPISESGTIGTDGKIALVGSHKLQPGRYQVVALLSDARGAQSLPTQPIEFTVNPTIMGMIKRHPMVPVAVGGLIFLLLASWFIIRKIRSSHQEEQLPKTMARPNEVVKQEHLPTTQHPSREPITTVSAPTSEAHHMPKMEKGVIDLRG